MLHRSERETKPTKENGRHIIILPFAKNQHRKKNERGEREERKRGERGRKRRHERACRAEPLKKGGRESQN